MAVEKVLVVDDELLIREFLVETLSRRGLEVHSAACGEEALPLVEQHSFDLMITDMKMPGMTGLELLRRVKADSPRTLVIVITAFGSIENAVEAMRIGAFNYLIKPFSPDTIEAILERADEHTALVNENEYLREQVSGQGPRGMQRIVGSSPVMQRILGDVKKVAKSNASIFINGESGTGKEVIASAIHHYSHRAGRPYIKVNCAAIPETLIESEFFGHEKGAFTGANQKRMGRFELAHGGTLLLDEITEVPIGLQAKLLRVIQEQEFERVGGTKEISVDVRLVSTSNRDMREAIADNVFREDLFYRLNVVPIDLPPLRDRREDIIPLAEFFLEKFCVDNHKDRKRIDGSAQSKLLNYPWPGNIRELANIIERAVVMDHDTCIAAEHLYLDGGMSTANLEDDPIVPVGMTLQELEKHAILETLQRNSANRTRAAEVLGISVRTLRNKLNEYRAADPNLTA